MTKRNERDDDLNMKDLKVKFPQIVDFCKVDSLDGTGIDLLKEIIYNNAKNLPHMQTVWIPEWFEVRTYIENDERNWIEYEQFKRVCYEKGVPEKQVDILAEYLHNLGIIIHFRDRLELRNLVILKPEWATNAVYNILDYQPIRDRGGVLLYSELEKIWDSSIYPFNLYPQILELMKKFELSYELPDKESHLVAELLPKTEPEFMWDNKENLRFYYRYEFLPAGIMTRFIVLIHQDLEIGTNGKHLCWREGAILQRENTRALVKIKSMEKLIEIRISGKKKRELLAIIRHQFDHINSSIKNIKINEEIPCNCTNNCIQIFDYNDLINGEQKGKKEIICPKSFERISLLRLLDGYEKREDRVKDDDRNFDINISPKIKFSPTIENSPHFTQENIQVQTSNQTISVDIDLKIDLAAIQSDFEKLYDLLIGKSPELEGKLNRIMDGLDELSTDDDKKEIKKPLNKLGRFLKDLSDEKSDYHKYLKGAQKGIETAQKIAKTYNKFAQWLALPQVPDVFLGK